MSGFRWVILPLWLSGPWSSFLYSSYVYSCHLFLISLVSVRSILFFIVPIFVWNVPLVFLSFLKRSLVFSILLFSSYFFALNAEEGFLISSCYSVELCIQMGMFFLFCFAFASLLFTAIRKASSDSHFVFLDFFSLGMVKGSMQEQDVPCLLYNVRNLCP